MKCSPSRTVTIVLAVMVLCALGAVAAAAAGATDGDSDTERLDADSTLEQIDALSEQSETNESVSTGAAADQTDVSEELSAEFAVPSQVVDRGDIDTITVKMDGTEQAVVRIEDQFEAYFATLIVEANESGETTIQWNTYRAAQGTPDAAFTATEGEVVDAEEFEIPDHSPNPRIIEDDYDLTAYPLEEATENVTEVDLDELDSTANATRFVNNPSNRAIDATPLTAPAGTIDPASDSVEDVRAVSTQTDEVAIEDFLVVQYEATGVFGYLVDDFDEYIGAEEGIELRIFSNPRNTEPPVEFTPDDDGIDIVSGPEDNEFFLVVDTALINDAADISTATSVESTFSITEDNDYIETDEKETTVSEATILDRSVEVTGTFRDNALLVSEQEHLTVQTSLAPGTNVTVEATTENESIAEATVTIGDDRTGSAGFDFSDRLPGTDIGITSTGPLDTVDNQPAVLMRNNESIDRTELSGETVYCCSPLEVTGFDANKPVLVESDEGAGVITADTDGVATIKHESFPPGTYTVIPDGGDEYGPFEFRETTFEEFDLNQSTVDQGEHVELTVASDRADYVVELFEANNVVLPGIFDDAIDTGVYSEQFNSVYVTVPDGERTVTIDTQAIPPGTYEFTGTMLDADTAATTTLEVRSDTASVVPTAVAPMDAVGPSDDPSTVRANLTARTAVAVEDIAAIDLPASIDEDATVRVSSLNGSDSWNRSDDGVTLHTGDAEPVVTVDTGVVSNPPVTPDTVYEVTVEDNTDTITATVGVEQRQVFFALPYVGDPPKVPTEPTTVAAKSNIAPGSEIFLRARSRSPNPFLQDTTVELAEQGVARATFNFSERIPRQEFMLTARHQSSGAETRTTAIFTEDATADGVSWFDGGVVDQSVPVYSGVPYESAVLWQLDDQGERDKPVTRLTADEDGVLYAYPGLIENGESYVLVDRYGSISGEIKQFPGGESYLEESRVVSLDGGRAAIDDWKDGSIDTDALVRVIDAWASGAPVLSR